jgi:hypothetical protein
MYLSFSTEPKRKRRGRLKDLNMKKTFYLSLPAIALAAAGAFCLLFIAGCQETVKKGKPVEVIIDDGNGVFPRELVGRWIGDTQGWEIVFEPNGTISSVVIPLGGVTVYPGKTTIVPMIRGGRGVYKAGQWTVQYSYASRELAVDIVIDYYNIRTGNESIKGSLNEYLTGKVELGGWTADWITNPIYIVNTPVYRNHLLPMDVNESDLGTVIFLKVAPK